MKRVRSSFIGLLACAWLLAPGAAFAAQGSCAMPTTGPKTMATVMGLLNTCLTAIFSSHSGASAPANNPSSAISTYQVWVDTSTSPPSLKIYDGAQSVVIGTLDSSAHVWAPSGAGGDIKLLNTMTASSSASLSDTTSFTASYDNYLIVLENVVPATNGDTLKTLVHSGGTFQATGYLNSAGAATTFIDLTGGNSVKNTAGTGISGIATVSGVSSTTTNKIFRGNVGYYLSVGGVGGATDTGAWNGGQGAVDGVQFLFTGNIATGTIKIYGLK